MSAERLQKILAHAGVASRRKAEELIEAGHVSVNGKVVRELGSKADLDQDLIQVDGRTIRETQDKVYYVLYKPAGCVTTLSDPENRPTIKAYLEEIPERVYPVGRLDYDVEGALIVTNDGDLAFSMMHPRFGVRRTYLAKVHGVPAAEQLERLRRGVRLEDGRARALEADLHSRTPKNTWVRVVVAEGRQHLVKRLMEAVGAPVQKLHRADYGGIGVGGMRPGEVRELTRAEVQSLRAQAGKKAEASDRRAPVALPARRHGHGPPSPGGRTRRGRHSRR
ncbi:MAG: rRNA pseudouridine synthase [Deltaproteobacteria bacterium]|nr:MAG: rRNA pseudouridine synthase [Deltaproteobacteria bacterium]TMB34444.1 MAG: rRNA pseudouridine synthase [Deltaproteobacteria bacterium]